MANVAKERAINREQNISSEEMLKHVHDKDEYSELKNVISNQLRDIITKYIHHILNNKNMTHTISKHTLDALNHFKHINQMCLHIVRYLENFSVTPIPNTPLDATNIAHYDYIYKYKNVLKEVNMSNFNINNVALFLRTSMLLCFVLSIKVENVSSDAALLDFYNEKRNELLLYKNFPLSDSQFNSLIKQKIQELQELNQDSSNSS